jgi:hypothetical protein
MKANKIAMLTLTLLSMMTIACSSKSSMENTLVGEWQSNGPESIRLKITKVGTDRVGFHDGYSSTDDWPDGETSTYVWRIDSDSEGSTLELQGKGYWDDFERRTFGEGGASMSQHSHRIIDLTSDRFVVDMNSSLSNRTNIVEFHRVKVNR